MVTVTMKQLTKGETKVVTKKYNTTEEAMSKANNYALMDSICFITVDDTIIKDVTVNDATNKEEENMVQVTKETIRKELKVLGIELSESKFNRTKKEVLLAMLEKAKAEMETDVQRDAQQQIDNHEIMHGDVVTMEDMDMEYEAREEHVAPADYETIAATHQVIMTDHAYYDKQTVEFTGTKQQCMDYVETNKIHVVQEGGDAYLFSYTVEPVPATVPAIDDVWNADMATKVLVNIINKAKDNNFISFISHHMATSAMCEILCGRPLKDRITKKENSFTDEEKKLVAQFREKFAEKYLIMNERGTGYNIRAVGMVWYYKKVVYRYQNKTQIVDYVVDFKAKTITRKDGTGKPTILDTAAYETLDRTCRFMYVVK